jgi:hypothetical protein
VVPVGKAPLGQQGSPALPQVQRPLLQLPKLEPVLVLDEHEEPSAMHMPLKQHPLAH